MCQICPDGLGTTMEGEVLTAFDVCRFLIYVHERKEGTQACLQRFCQLDRSAKRFCLLRPRPPRAAIARADEAGTQSCGEQQLTIVVRDRLSESRPWRRGVQSRQFLSRRFCWLWHCLNLGYWIAGAA
ncbi:cellulose synthase A catalytic subunit 3 [UDP-forming] [Triticum aestivum]|uniref:cellulose synthase A catalytic subunit 3 [UDP-forming] n=1 Tax=Triticum aestivum TaxID=4565 RepID=UPI001D01FB2A|nr:cellulose synthase A catalytic subunit 3 [UDP-forming]-like [Triticum aestivum]